MDRTPTTTRTRIARTALSLAILGGTLAASATALADPAAGDSPGRSAEAPGQQEAHPAEGTPPAALPEQAAPQAQEHAAASPSSVDDPGGEAAPVVAGDGEEAPGNRGTIKTHLSTTPDDDRRDEPHFCAGRLVGFGFPEDANLEIAIEGHGGPNSGPDTFDTTVTADMLSETGDFALALPTLADGMYKITADNVTAPGFAKQKVIKVECPVEVLPEEEEPEIPPTIIDEEEEEEVLGVTIVRPARIEEVVTAAPAAPAANEQVLGVQIQRGALARTGMSVSLPVLLGFALLIAGLALVATGRRSATRR